MVTAHEAEAQEAAVQQAQERPAPPTLRSVLSAIQETPAAERKYGARSLLSCLSQLECVEARLASRSLPDAETLAELDTVLLAWLCAVFHGLSGSPAVIHGDLLEPELIASGIVAPFVQPGPDGAASFGVPSNSDVLCDSVSELVRMAAAALISLYVYLNYQQGPGDLASDEVLLVFATMAIASCVDAANAASLDAQIAALIEADLAAHGAASPWAPQPGAPGSSGGDGGDVEEPRAFGCAQIRWLMHYARGLIFHHMAAVNHLLDNREGQAQAYFAEQKDMQSLIKALPEHPLGYELFARCAMSHQQHSLAAAFLQRGLDAAAALGHDGGTAAMSFQRAAALLLGGGGPQADAAELQALLAAGEAARDSVLAWFPAAWRALAPDGEPDRSLIKQKLLPELRRRAGCELPAQGEVQALAGLIYVTRAPSSVPPGAVRVTDGAAGEEGQA